MRGKKLSVGEGRRKDVCLSVGGEWEREEGYILSGIDGVGGCSGRW